MGNCCSAETDSSQQKIDVERNKDSPTKSRRSRKSAKGAGVEDQHVDELRETVAETSEEQMWDDVTDKDDKITDEKRFEDNEVSLVRAGRTYPLFKEKYMDEARKNLKRKTKDVFNELGQFMYRISDIKSLSISDSDLEARILTKCNDSSYYFGQWNKSNNEREGRGVAIFKDGSIYEGFWKGDKKEGQGRLIYPTGDVYQGEWKNGVSEGYGIFISKTGFKTKGWWKNGKLEGKGFELMTDGSTYRGHYCFLLLTKFDLKIFRNF